MAFYDGLRQADGASHLNSSSMNVEARLAEILKEALRGRQVLGTLRQIALLAPGYAFHIEIFSVNHGNSTHFEISTQEYNYMRHFKEMLCNTIDHVEERYMCELEESKREVDYSYEGHMHDRTPTTKAGVEKPKSNKLILLL